MLGENAKLRVVSETQSNLMFSLLEHYKPYKRVKTSFTFIIQRDYTFPLLLYSSSSLAISSILEMECLKNSLKEEQK